MEGYGPTDEREKERRFDDLRNLVRRGRTVVVILERVDRADAVAHVHAWNEAGRYLELLRQEDVQIEPEQLTAIRDTLDALEAAAQAGDLDHFLSLSRKMLSALPGDPTIGVSPPIPEPKPQEKGTSAGA